MTLRTVATDLTIKCFSSHLVYRENTNKLQSLPAKNILATKMFFKQARNTANFNLVFSFIFSYFPSFTSLEHLKLDFANLRFRILKEVSLCCYLSWQEQQEEGNLHQPKKRGGPSWHSICLKSKSPLPQKNLCTSPEERNAKLLSYH